MGTIEPMRTVLCSINRSRILLMLAAVVLTACQTTPIDAPPQPELQLVQSIPLELASDCSASGSFAVAFVVAPTGRAIDVKPADAPVCVQQALTAWVESFRYAPPGRAIPTTIEWMMVSAKRGT